MKARKIIALSIIALCLPFLSTASIAQPLTKSDLSKVESYLNSIKTLKGRFLQIDSAGGQIQGTVYLKRPGKMRFEYDKPSPVTLIADGTWLIHYDEDLEQASRALQGSTPADILTRSNLSLGGEIAVINSEKTQDVWRLTLQSKSEPDFTLTIFLNPNPMRLKQWDVIDQNGENTTIALLTFKTGLSIKEDKFNFISPEWERWKKNRN